MSTTAKIMKEPESKAPEELSEPVTIGVEAYISEDYARAERDKLWRKVWLQVGRVEEIPNVGDYITYEVLDDSILIVRAANDEIRAYHNVCAHRGRRLVDTPKGAKHARGRALPVVDDGKELFTCAYHGWRYGLDGQNAGVAHKGDWKDTLKLECIGLSKVNVDTWGGWIWINMDPKCEPLRQYLEPAASMLDPFQLQNMRYRWRKWGIFDCNWKVALEAFYEAYHVETTHPEFNEFAKFRAWARVQGRHSNIGYDPPKGMDAKQQGTARGAAVGDARISLAKLQIYTYEKSNTNTTKTFVEAAKRLKDELPEGTPAAEVYAHWQASARRDDAARGVIWPTVDPEHAAKAGTTWQLFPNFQIGQALQNMLCYSARPYGYDPDKCIFEAAVYELYPKGEEPQTEWVYSEPTAEAWSYVLGQDFSNMAAVQRGIHIWSATSPIFTATWRSTWALAHLGSSSESPWLSFVSTIA
jgi:phenylpropionate dioxygenase-like ring-hydroxylating dioxygenase large terminal subunit